MEAKDKERKRKENTIETLEEQMRALKLRRAEEGKKIEKILLCF